MAKYLITVTETPIDCQGYPASVDNYVCEGEETARKWALGKALIGNTKESRRGDILIFTGSTRHVMVEVQVRELDKIPLLP